ncbi:MAG: DEAD/DEAH box helicase [Synechococcaceae cyanobacterium SM2_3_2]|nr:DEAD/DEAH box helicase [Synechococcaceae cyanobacterium SM2_3_2]
MALPQLYGFQSTLLAQIHHHYREGYRRLLVYAPTGAGKTLLSVHLIQQRMQAGEKCLFVVRHQPLVDQTLAYILQMGPRAGVIKAGYAWDPTHPIQVASLQTLNRRRYWPEADWILLDEAHGCTAPQYDSVFGRYDGATFVGLSATPFLLHRNRPLSTRFEALLASPQVTDLIEAGYLVPPMVYGHPPDSLDTRTIRILGGDYDRHELALKCNTSAMTAALVKEWQQRAAGRRTLAFAVDRLHAQAIAAAFRAAGIPAESLDGTTSERQRRQMYGRLRRGETLVLSSCGVLNEGFDEPSVSALLLARPTRSRVLYLQQVGRGLRPDPSSGKQDCIILDQAGNSWRLGLPTDPLVLNLEADLHTRSGTAPLKRCPDCTAILPMATRLCPVCHHAFIRDWRMELLDTLEPIAAQQVDPKVVDLMVALKRKQENSGYRLGWVYFAFMKQHKRPTLPELQLLAQVLGYEPGWAWFRWRQLQKGSSGSQRR